MTTLEFLDLDARGCISLAQRQDIVREALTWERTPFRHQGKVKGVGCDCAMFPVAVYQLLGLIPPDYQPEYYPMDWHLHHGHHGPNGRVWRGHEGHALEGCGDERYLREVLRFAYGVDAPQPGDFVLYRFGRAYAHGGIVLAWPEIIHSARTARMVTRAYGLRDGELSHRNPIFFSLWGRQ
ncbi:MAG: hypothetical protein ACRD3E_12875 [Terriglobales bacterium]